MGANAMKRLIPLVLLVSWPLAAQQYKLALVGLNHDHVWAQLPTILSDKSVKLVGIGETLADRVARVAQEETSARGGTRPAVASSLIFGDWKKMIDETKPDIVWAFLETSRHLEVVEYCAPRGIHVMFEYPLAVKYEDALAIQALARRYNTKVLTNYLYWSWTAPTYAAKAAVDAGAIGPVYRLSGLLGHGGPGDYRQSTFLTWLMSVEKNGGGAGVDFAAPLVVWALWVKGLPQSVYSRMDHLRPEEFNGVDDNATIIMNYKDGVAILEGTWDMAAGPTFSNQIIGRSGALVIGRNGVEMYKPAERRPGAGRAPAVVTQLPIEPLPAERSGALAYMVDRIRRKLPLEDMSAVDVNVQVVEVFEAAANSSRTARAIDLPLR
jgi:predicted dehydrogenase